eukprot:9456762-Pyramimonas_sp.AAC.1
MAVCTSDRESVCLQEDQTRMASVPLDFSLQGILPYAPAVSRCLWLSSGPTTRNRSGRAPR